MSAAITVPLYELKSAVYDAVEKVLVEDHSDKWSGPDGDENILTIDFGVDSEEFPALVEDIVETVIKLLVDY